MNVQVHSLGINSDTLVTLTHSLVSKLGPSPLQSFPDPIGAGLVHVRVRFWTPVPQVTEHFPKELHFE